MTGEAKATPSGLAIDVKGLSKTFGHKRVVDDISLQVRTGEIFGFLGPNGSGKTTCLRMICGLLTLDSGSGTCLGFDIVKQSAQIKRQTGYMTQKFSYWDDLTIRENLDFVARLYQMPDREQAVTQALHDLGLTTRSNQLTGELSGGWKQRLALACCVLHKPKLLLLDEPTAGVDPTARRDFWDELHRLAASGISVLVTTHYMDEAERCHKLAYVAYGKLLAQGSAREVVESQHLATWAIQGENLAELSQHLHGAPGVAQMVSFGSALHVSGTDEEGLRRTLQKLTTDDPNLHVERVATGLEEAFIYLTARSTDNYAVPAQTPS